MRAWPASLALVITVASATPATGPVEIDPAPDTWTTWVVGAPSGLRPPAPPVTMGLDAEQLRSVAAHRDGPADAAIAYWDTGPPSYRWSELAIAEALRRHQYTHVAVRGLALLHVAIDDALAVVWEAKHAYRRSRPTEVRAAVAVPASPSYPAEHAAAAAAASEILAYLYPDRAAFYADQAREAAHSRIVAGVNFPSDVQAGSALGREVARRVIASRRVDGSDRAWTGSIPAGEGKWTGANPALPEAANWRPWVLASADALRPPPPPAHDSPQLAAEIEELRRFPRTPTTNADALFWEHAAGGARSYQFWNDVLGRKLLEYRLEHDAPRAARSYALLNVTLHDVAVACWDAKYTYWAMRPIHVDPAVQPLFTTPNHPSYPSGHSCLSSAAAAVLASLFPRDASTFEALALVASESRVWAGIHFRSDLAAGRALGEAVAARVLARYRPDGGR